MTFFQHPSRRQNRLLLATKLNKQAARPIWDFEVGLGHLWPTPSPTPASPLLTPFHQQNLPSGSLYDLAWALRLTSSKIRLDSSPCHSSDPSNKGSTGYRFNTLSGNSPEHGKRRDFLTQGFHSSSRLHWSVQPRRSIGQRRIGFGYSSWW